MSDTDSVNSDITDSETDEAESIPEDLKTETETEQSDTEEESVPETKKEDKKQTNKDNPIKIIVDNFVNKFKRVNRYYSQSNSKEYKEFFQNYVECYNYLFDKLDVFKKKKDIMTVQYIEKLIMNVSKEFNHIYQSMFDIINTYTTFKTVSNSQLKFLTNYQNIYDIAKDDYRQIMFRKKINVENQLSRLNNIILEPEVYNKIPLTNSLTKEETNKIQNQLKLQSNIKNLEQSNKIKKKIKIMSADEQDLQIKKMFNKMTATTPFITGQNVYQKYLNLKARNKIVNNDYDIFTNSDITEVINYLNWELNRNHSNQSYTNDLKLFETLLNKKIYYGSPYKKGIDIFDLLSRYKDDEIKFKELVEKLSIDDFAEIINHLKWLRQKTRFFSNEEFHSSVDRIVEIYKAKNRLDAIKMNNIDEIIEDVNFNDFTSLQKSKRYQKQLKILEEEEEKLRDALRNGEIKQQVAKKQQKKSTLKIKKKLCL